MRFFCRSIGPMLVGCGMGFASLAPGRTLDSVAAVRGLGADEVAAGVPVALEATVTFSSPRFATLFVTDGLGGIFVEQAASSDEGGLKAGDVVRVKGVTGPGMFAPVVRATEVMVVSSGPLPPGRWVDGEELARPDQDSNWIEVEADVKEVTQSGASLRLECQAGSYQFLAEVPAKLEPEDVPWDLAESRVRIRGVAATIFNSGRQMTRRLVRINSLDDVRMLGPSRDAAPQPMRVTIDRLLRIDGPGPSDLVRISGIVNLALPGRGFYLRTEEGGIWVQTAQPIAAKSGALVEVDGWPRAGGIKPFIRARRAVVVGAGISSGPLRLTARKALHSRHDSELVSVDAELLEGIRTAEGMTLELRDAGSLFRAVLPDGASGLPPGVVPGSRVRVTGIAEILPAEPAAPFLVDSKLVLRLRSIADLALLAPPPWWTVRRVVGLAAAIIAGLLLVYLRARIRRHRESEAQRREFEVVLSERGRFAREIHDSLAQGLTSISLQLECVRDELTRDPESAASHVETARALVRDSLREARRTIWNLRPLALGEADLASALKGYAADLTRSGKVSCGQEIEGSPRPLPVEHENALLRIGQESLTNAIRHAKARRILVRLRFGDGWVSLVVSDDGDGFDVSERFGKGFGLSGMRERVVALGGSISIDSKLGEGTEVSATLPT
jgi:signal transduction histidine kinase